MKRSSILAKLTANMDNLHELGRQQAFELGNAFYFKKSGDGDHYRKELPTGEIYLVDIEIINDEHGYAKEIRDTIIRQL